MEDEVRYRKNVYHALTMITQFGINMLVPIFLCSFIGIYIDRKFDTSFWMVLLFFVGALAGFRNVFVFARRIYTMKSERDTAHGRKADASGRTGSRREQGGKGR
ncbi:MAG: AtpZ/AtpI family protein [Lachnospiraceae bacterium]|nr:AtpZ/AtpI family protein [Lachnospiraceae bacterium]